MWFKMSSLLICLLTLTFHATAGRSLSDNRVINGKVVSIEQFPYQASLHDNGTFFCSAVIVGNQFALTAAHCLKHKDSKGKTLRVGSALYKSGGTVYDIESFVIHPRYEYSSACNLDIAVIKLKTVLDFNKNVGKIALVEENDEPAHGEMATTAGWGVTSFDSRNPSEQLRSIKIPIIERLICAEPYDEYEDITITVNMICAGGASKSVFVGDSGGPLVNEDNQLVGIVSFGQRSTNLGYPSVFTNLASPSIREFILNNTEY